MVIVSQDLCLIESYQTIGTLETRVVAIHDRLGERHVVSTILGEYRNFGRCQEVIRQIVNAYKEGLPVFEMPKE